jgi:hypothetical protein
MDLNTFVDLSLCINNTKKCSDIKFVSFHKALYFTLSYSIYIIITDFNIKLT